MQNPRILLIEDTDSVREVLSRQLEILGASVTALADGDMVKRELDKISYDLVIADLHLPNCSGFDIARFAKAKNCKIILLSGDAQAAGRDDFLTAQFDQVLLKPVTLQNLKNMLLKHGLISNDDPIIANTNFDRTDLKSAINLRVLEEQMGNLDSVAIQMLARFPEMMRPLVQKISDPAVMHDKEALKYIAHSLKSAARSAGALLLGDMVERVQEQATKNVYDQKQIDALCAEFSRVEMELHDLCKEKVAIS